MSLIEKAARVAAHAHRNQYRKFPGPDGRLAPYVVHPARVASLATIYYHETSRGFKFDEVVAAAWLHDTTLGDFYLTEMFGTRVGSLVNTMTRKAGQGRQEYYDGFVHRPTAASLKLADVVANLEDSLLAPPDFQKQFAAKCVRFLATVRPHMASLPQSLWADAIVRLNFLASRIDVLREDPTLRALQSTTNKG